MDGFRVKGKVVAIAIGLCRPDLAIVLGSTQSIATKRNTVHKEESKMNK